MGTITMPATTQKKPIRGAFYALSGYGVFAPRVLQAPSVITDFVAVGGVGEVTISYTDATGGEPITHNLVDVTNSILVAIDVSSGQTYPVVDTGTITFVIAAVNSEDTTFSNSDDAVISV